MTPKSGTCCDTWCGEKSCLEVGCEEQEPAELTFEDFVNPHSAAHEAAMKKKASTPND